MTVHTEDRASTEGARARLFTGGTVWPDALSPDSDALLIADGAVVALGAQAVAHPLAAEAEQIDLAGGFLMPSFAEGHAHPIFGGLESQGPQIVGLDSVEAIIAEVRRYADANPTEEWIIGASYNGSLVEHGLFDARWLDEAVPDRPVLLRAWDYHTVWCNSRALELAGITANTPEPELGEIPRRPDGSPLGVLREWGAIDLINAVQPGHSLDARLTALRTAHEHYAALGTTWIQDAWVEPADVEVYVAAAARGQLLTRMNLALLADPRHFPAQLPELLAARQRIRDLGHPLLTANTIKFFADGVIENETGALLEPYCTGAHQGMRVWQPEALAAAVAAVEAEGFQPFIHAIGDAAVRTALDAIEHSRTVNGEPGTRPVITHVQLAAAEDLARFARLGVIANLQPLWSQQDSLMTVLTVPRLGPERSDRQYQSKTLTDSGATVSFGSDWPCSSADVREGIAIAATRTTADGAPEGGWVPEQILPLGTCLGLATAGTAAQAFADRLDTPWGTLAPGNAADLVWFARDPRAESPKSFPDNPIRATFLAGTPTYRANTERAW